jgi:hypothetical protein
MNWSASYLIAYVYGISVVWGSLFFLLTGNLVTSGWFPSFRAPGRWVAASLPAFVLLFLPIAFQIPHLYPWSQSDHPYLNIPSFLIRALIYFSGWWLLSEHLFRGKNSKKMSVGGLLFMFFTLTFAGIDWLMSLEAHWTSTVYGLYLFSGSVTAALSLIVILTYFFCRDVPFDHYHSLGKLVFTFVFLWGYLGFSQFIVTYMADLPEEAAWYVRRLEGGWKGWAVFLTLGHFFVPFVLLLPKSLKRNPEILTAICGWLLIAHFADLYWLIAPAFEESRAWPGSSTWLLLVLVGVSAFGFSKWRRG